MSPLSCKSSYHEVVSEEMSGQRSALESRLERRGLKTNGEGHSRWFDLVQLSLFQILSLVNLCLFATILVYLKKITFGYTKNKKATHERSSFNDMIGASR